MKLLGKKVAIILLGINSHVEPEFSFTHILCVPNHDFVLILFLKIYIMSYTQYTHMACTDNLETKI